MKDESLSERMHRAFHLALKICYSELTPDGHYFTPRDSFGTRHQEEMVIGWADGLVHKYYETHATGRCSLTAMVAFDVAKFEASVLRDIAIMERLLGRHGPPVQLTKDEMRRRGYIVA